MTLVTLIDNFRHGNALAIYDLLLLVVIYAGSTLMARVGSSRLREHESSGGNNRSIKNLFWAIVITNEIAIPITCISIGALVALLARREATLRIRMMVMLVNESLHRMQIPSANLHRSATLHRFSTRVASSFLVLSAGSANSL